MAATALTIAGSDSGGGAGIQADLKTFSAFGVYGCSVVTAVTAQNTRDVTAVHPIPNHIVAAQIKAVLSDITVHAIKIGMLGTPDLIDCVADCIKRFDGPVIVDPVMVAKSGARLLPDESLDALRWRLVPLAAVLTPNIPEAARLLGTREQTESGALREQGRMLLQLGPDAVLMKGGHGTDEICTDWLIKPECERFFCAPRIDTRNTHGTGCTMSSAIAAGLAKGQSIDIAVAAAHAWLQQAIRCADSLSIGRGHGPVHHFFEVWK